MLFRERHRPGSGEMRAQVVADVACALLRECFVERAASFGRRAGHHAEPVEPERRVGGQRMERREQAIQPFGSCLVGRIEAVAALAVEHLHGERVGGGRTVGQSRIATNSQRAGQSYFYYYFPHFKP